jgi:hypothetical protein
MVTINAFHPDRVDTKNKEWDFLFQVSIRDKVFTYLTTNIKNKTSIESYSSNFSTFFDISIENAYIWTLWFSIVGVSLFDKNLSNQRDYRLERNSDTYQTLEKIEHIHRLWTPLSHKDIEYIKRVYDAYMQSWPQDWK